MKKRGNFRCLKDRQSTCRSNVIVGTPRRPGYLSYTEHPSRFAIREPREERERLFDLAGL